MADAGDVLRFFLDAGEPVENVSASLKGEGHRLLAMEEKEGYFVLTVEKVES